MEKILLKLAREAIKEQFGKEISIDLEKILNEHPQLKEEKATFVTLYLNGELRGCIGSLQAHQPLYQDIISNALSAAFKDTRFEPLTYEELKKVKIEISILTEPQKVKYSSIEELKKLITPFKDGIILKYKDHSSTYLPSVWEQLPDFNSFFKNLCIKAGLKENCLNKNPKIYKYQVDKFEESYREAYNSGFFYPNNQKELKQYFNSINLTDTRPKALIVPHAGYMYSGNVADAAYKYIKGQDYKRIIVIGPSHHIYFKGISGSFYKRYKTPLGDIKIDLKYLNMLKKEFNITFVEEAHQKEHSTETQMPFIKNYSNAKVIELIYSEEHNLSDIVGFLLKDKDNLVVISTDLSHFYSLQQAYSLDKNCIDGIRTLDMDKLNACEACGILGVKALIHNVKLMNLKTKILKYKTSFEATGDESSVVGYLSAIIE